jgi:3-hydroxyacyl-CoA dehydrogenase
VSKIPFLSREVKAQPLTSIGVIGAGTMGGGIAMACLDAGFPVTLVEQNDAALERGLATIKRNYQTAVDKGRLTAAALEEKLSRLKPALELAALAETDLIIEAVFERMDIKTALFEKLDGIAKPSAVLASNTSFLDLNEIAAATKRPRRVVGLHFFSPANVMKLLEVVRGEKTEDAVIATALAFGRKLGKVSVLAGVCFGFIANRAMFPRTQAGEKLILEGPLPWEIDRALTAYGFPMGVFSMLDLVGLDVIGWDAATSKGETVQEKLCEAGRWGQKRSGGYYNYDEKRAASPSPEAEAIIREVAAAQGIAPKPFTNDEIIARLLYPVVNESARLLEEKIALRASDIDIALIYGYGWPVYRGGPMMWADLTGLPKIIAGLEAQGIAPCALLRDAAASGRKLHEL